MLVGVTPVSPGAPDVSNLIQMPSLDRRKMGPINFLRGEPARFSIGLVHRSRYEVIK
jgi:hypothetical protein